MWHKNTNIFSKKIINQLFIKIFNIIIKYHLKNKIYEFTILRALHLI